MVTLYSKEKKINVPLLAACLLPILLGRGEAIPEHNSQLTGTMRYEEMMNSENPHKFRNAARMDKPTFLKLLRVLTEESSLEGGYDVCAGQKLFMFLYALTGFSCRQIGEAWQRSTNTVSRAIHAVCNAITSLSSRFFIPPELDPILNEKFDAFEGVVGALDGSHIHCVPPAEDASVFRDRKKQLSQNVLGVCNFDLTFSYCLAGWEGSAHDGQVLADAVSKGCKCPDGHYFLADAGYALSKMCLTPYRGVRYHLKEWRMNNEAPQTKEELFNLRHSSLRNCVERIFGVVKKRFPCLVNMKSYDFPTQVNLVQAAFMIHNFIRLEQEFEDEFDRWSDDIDEVEDDPGLIHPEVAPRGPAGADFVALNTWRDGIAQRMWNEYQDYMTQLRAGANV